eukprot:s3168_g3.t1
MPGASEFKVKDLVYVPCEGKEVPFLAGIVHHIEGSEAVIQVADEHQRFPVGELRRRFKGDDGATCDDNTSLVHLNDATILENLKARHEADDIYTYTASVLLAVNPYKDVTGLYGESQCKRYRGKHIGALPPHPYAIADTAYRALVRDRKNQGFIISGESGAGKTETAKIVMEYLGYVSGSTNQKTEQIQRRVQQAQPILESFGNAVTMRNNNSSRFGKYNRVFFDETGTLVDASVTTYLLESSRVVVHAKRERTYHCFYEMLRGLPDEKLSKLQLQRDKLYLLLASESTDSQDDLVQEMHWHAQFKERDAKLFQHLCSALSTVGFSDEEIDSIFQVLAGLVHLGDLSNAERDEGDEAATVQLDDEILDKAARLLGMETNELGAALLRRKVRIQHAGRESLHEVPRTTSQFRHALHSLIKALYKRLFERLVERINSSFGEWRQAPQEDDPWHQIGILDIYGFERLQRNSFEQLCINLANERLQQYFIENVLVAEQELYKREALPWMGLDLPDSTPVVTAIVQTFKTLDEYSQQLAKGFEKTSDESFCQKTVDDSQKDAQRKEILRPLKMSNKRGSKAGLGPAMNEGFIIKHYAGFVEYNTKGWLDKNNDRLLVECEDLICDSNFQFVKDLGESDGGKVPFKSISKKYCADLENLLETLNTCHLHYIRCFKPNECQKPAIFHETLVMDQLVQCGTIELVKIMHDGYPNRCPFNEMMRFRDLLPEYFQRYGMRTFIEALMLAHNVPKEEWALGMSRLFLKAGQLKALEDLRAEGAEADPERLRQIVHDIIRKKWVRAKNAIQLVHYLPRFLSALRTARAARTLCTRALLIGRLQPMLMAAREKLRLRAQAAQRRIRGAVWTVRLSVKLMQQAKSNRRERLVKAIYLRWLLHKRLQPAIQGARTRLIALEVQREAERRREEERRAAEEKRRHEEEMERMKEQLRREYEEKERIRAEAAAEAKRQEEEQARRAAEAQAQKEEELRRVKEELEAKKREEEHRAEAALVNDVPSPCRNSPSRQNTIADTGEDDARPATETGGSSAEIKELRERVRKMEEHEREILFDKEIQFKEMQERIQKMEELMEEKQNQTREEMMRLLQKQQQANVRNFHPEMGQGLQMTPPRDRGDKRRLSTASVATNCTVDTVDRERRKSNVHQQKLMWKEHREILMTDLYSPDMFDLPRNGRARRSSVRGDPLQSLEQEAAARRISRVGR